jgi:general stress protein 26
MNGMDVKKLMDELKAVGVGAVGLKTPEAKELVRILHPDEHIGGVVYGRYATSFAWLIATDRRVIFIDKKPLHTTMDELTYDVVSGVRSHQAGLVASVTLHTRINDYAIRYVNKKCARIFVKYIEDRRLESGKYDVSTSRYNPQNATPPAFKDATDEAIKFLKNHDLGVLSTIDRTGNVHGAVIYYLVDENNFVYMLTKSETGKGRNVYAHSQVALTVHETGTMKTVQLQGIANVETNQQTKDNIFSEMVKPRLYSSEMKMPPVTKLHEGAFMIIRINPTIISFHDYENME